MSSPHWLRTTRWIAVFVTFAVLAADNVRLAVKCRRLRSGVATLREHRSEQLSVISDSRRLTTTAKRRHWIEYSQLKRLSAMMSWARNREHVLVRSGPQVVSQVVSLGMGHLRLLLYVPDVPQSAKMDCVQNIQIAITEAWGNDYRNGRETELRDQDPRTWSNRFTLDAVTPGVNQIDLAMDDSDGRFRLNVLVNDQLAHHVDVQPFRRPGSTFGFYFSKSFPNQAFGWTTPKFRRSGPPQHELLKHSFNLTSTTDRSLRGGVVIRCWLESNHPVSSSATYASAFFATIADQMLRKRILRFDELEDLFQPHDGSGKLVFKKRYSDAIQAQ